MLDSESIYRLNSDGHFVYKYAPTAAVFFIPFTLLSFEPSQWIFWFLLAFVREKTLQLLYLLNKKNPATYSANIIILTSLLTVGTHAHLE